MKKMTVKTETGAYREMETVTVKLANGDELEVKAWLNERAHSLMDYSVKLKTRDGSTRELV